MIEKENSLAYRFPELAQEWHPTKNEEFTPDNISYGSNKKVWWMGKCGHEWDSQIKERVRGYGCPICAGKRVCIGVNDLESNYPEIAAEWDYEKNSPIFPKSVTTKSHKIVWWICPKGHHYKSSIDNRTRGRGCPYCNSKLVIVGQTDLESQNPSLAKEYSIRNRLNADAVFANSHQTVWWSCSQCGHEWKASIDSRSRGNGCPECAKRNQSSFPEQALFYYVKQAYPDAINRCTSILDSRLELDIFIPSQNIAIEYDGQHWHTGSKASKREKDKYVICAEKGIFLIRVTDAFDEMKTMNCDYLITVNNNIDNAFEELGRFISIPEDINCERDRFKIMENYIRSSKENSLAIKRPELAGEWNYQKNGKLTPDMFSEFSMHAKVWWKCEKGHEWESTIAHRTSMGANCPYCSNRKVLIGYNDVATTHPTLLLEWDFAQNTYSPTDLTAGSKKVIWWKCQICGHSWKSPVYRRKSGKGCPICTRQKNKT